MTTSIELGKARGKEPARWRTKSGSGWSEWKQLGLSVEFLDVGEHQVASGIGQDEPAEADVYDVKSLIKGRGAAVDGMTHEAGGRLSPPNVNVIFFFQ